MYDGDSFSFMLAKLHQALSSSGKTASSASIKHVSHKEIEELIASAQAKGGRETIIVDLLDRLMLFAHSAGASDIHVEPLSDEEALVRLRVDGLLHDEFPVTKSIHNRVIARLKVMTDMRSDEHRAPQDGRFSFVAGEEKVDVRTSLIPVAHGEKAVMRLLSSTSHSLTLEQLGFSEQDLTRMQAHIQKPWGMILATGPTGSGKTTTIYAVLEQLNQRDVNITTIEDPIEFKIRGINQSQVDRAAKFTFADGLRSLLRQDPDIIMVGEIRDTETAKIAVNAALTGHKMLSTVHTNDAATTIPRLIDMGVEPFLVASTFNVAIAQRLMRRVCEKCKQPTTLSKKDATKFLSPEALSALFGSKASASIMQAKGCATCNSTGYKGRVGIYEVLTSSPDIEKLIISRANNTDIRTQAIKEGMTTMESSGIEKVKNGTSTMEEFMRVLHE